MIWGSWPLLKLLLPLCALGLIGIIIYGVRYYALVCHLAAPEHRRLMLPNFSSIRLGCKLFLYGIALIAIAIALLRPQMPKEKPTTCYEQGRDLVIAIDISRSMLAQDCTPDRLSCAKAKIMTLARELNLERLALVVFSGAAFVQCPLTKDLGAFQLFLDAVDYHSLSTGGTTALDAAILAGVKLFAESQRSCKLMVIVTDGDDFSKDLEKASVAAQQIGLKIAMLGVGSPEGAPVPLLDEQGRIVGHQKDAQGKVVISRLNEELLERVARDTGSFYTKLTVGTRDDIDRIVTWIKRYEAETFATSSHADYEEWHVVGSLIAFISLLFAWLL